MRFSIPEAIPQPGQGSEPEGGTEGSYPGHRDRRGQMYATRHDLPGRGMYRDDLRTSQKNAHQEQLFVVNSGTPEKCYVTNGNERERILGTLAQMDRALMSTPNSDPMVPNIEFSFSLDDLPLRSKAKGTFMGYTRKDEREYNDIWMMPNYAYWSWNYTHAPSWNSIRREIDMAEVKTPWQKKDPRVVWRGKIKMAELRKELVRVSEGKSWSDIKPVVINDSKDKHTKDVMNLRQFCGYVFIVDWFGACIANSYSDTNLPCKPKAHRILAD